MESAFTLPSPARLIFAIDGIGLLWLGELAARAVDRTPAARGIDGQSSLHGPAERELEVLVISEINVLISVGVENTFACG